MTKHDVRSDRAPEPVGPYPHAKRVGNLVFFSGVGPRKRGTKEIPGVTLGPDGKVAADELKEIVPDAEMAVVKEGLGRYACLSLSATAARDLIRETARRSVAKIGKIKPYKIPGPVTLQIEYTTRNSLAFEAQYRTGAEVLGDRTIRFKGRDILNVWRLYRSR